MNTCRLNGERWRHSDNVETPSLIKKERTEANECVTCKLVTYQTSVHRLPVDPEDDVFVFVYAPVVSLKNMDGNGKSKSQLGIRNQGLGLIEIILFVFCILREVNLRRANKKSIEK